MEGEQIDSRGLPWRGAPIDEGSLLEYIADAWERRAHLQQRGEGTPDQAVMEHRNSHAGRRAVDIDRVIDAAERRLADAKHRLQVLREYHLYLGRQLAAGGCDDTLRHTEAFFAGRNRAVELAQVAALLDLLGARCDCEAHMGLRSALG